MNPNQISPDDPRLTAYALNEMDPADRAGFEQLLAQDAIARQAVEAIVTTASLLTGALEHEALTPVEATAPRHDTYAKAIQFPYWKISGLAAACFTVFFLYLQRHETRSEQRQYIEVPLTAAPAAGEPEPVAPPAPTPLEAEKSNRDTLQAQALAGLAKKEEDGAERERMVAARNEAIESATRKGGVVAAPLPAPMVARDAAPAALAGGKPDKKDDTIALSSFEVAAPDKSSFGGGSNPAGPGGRSELKDMTATAAVAIGTSVPDRAPESNTGELRQDSGDLRTKVAAPSYSEVQRYLSQGQRPPVEAVRTEELVNHFSYNYPPPSGKTPFAANLEVAGAPWAPTHRLVRIGLRARETEVTAAGRTPLEQAGTLVTIAKDVKIQVEFNPRAVQAYRLIGYEHRRRAGEDFSHGRLNAGDDGTGRSLTALYEVVPVGVEMSAKDNTLKYERPQGPLAGTPSPGSMEMLTVEIRYKEPAGEANRRLEFPLRDAGMTFEQASEDFKFAASVAAFGMMLGDSPFKGVATWQTVADWAHAGLGHDAGGQRAEFLSLVAQAGAVLR